MHSAIDDVLSRGAIQYREMYYSGGNEIMFDAPRTAGEFQQLFTLDMTMKLYFNKTTQVSFSELITYSSLNPIPAILKLSNNKALPNTIYTRNFAGENFVELRFDKQTKKLYEITIVAVQEDTVKVVDNDKIIGDGFYDCFIENDSNMEMSQPVTVLRSSTSLCFFWGNQPSQMYPIADNCTIGTDIEKELCSVCLVNLSNELIYEILGF